MDFVALDVETANSSRDSICSIALIKFSNNIIDDAIYININPETSFSSLNTSIHGITQDDVANSPKMYQMHDAITRFMGDNIIVAHNTSFDMYSLSASFEKYGLTLPNNLYVCTYKLSKELYQLPSYRLQDLAKHFNIDNPQHHDALNDAKVCGKIFYNIINEQNLKLDELLKSKNLRYGKFGINGFVKKSSHNRSNKKFELSYNKELNDESHEFYGKHICFTGALKAFTRNEIAQKITDIGAIFDKSVKKSTNFLVVGNLENLEKSSDYKKSSKIIKAEQLSNEGQSIEIISELDFLKLL